MCNTAFYIKGKDQLRILDTQSEKIKNFILILYHRSRTAYCEALHFYFLQSLPLNVINCHCQFLLTHSQFSAYKTHCKTIQIYADNKCPKKQLTNQRQCYWQRKENLLSLPHHVYRRDCPSSNVSWFTGTGSYRKSWATFFCMQTGNSRRRRVWW